MDKFRIEIPEFSLVALIGGTSSGKSTFAKKHFLSTEILSSDFFRAMVCDDENSQSVSAEAFDLLYYAANKRLDLMKLTVIDATNIQQNARKRIIDIAKEQNVHAVAIVLNLPENVMQERNKNRPERNFPERVIHQHHISVKKSIKNLKREGFRFVYVINSLDELENVEIVRTKLWNDKKELHGPFDIIGDIHGCCTELEILLDKLGYVKGDNGYYHPDGRTAAFLGDFCDRGDRNADVLRLVMDMVKSGNAIAVPGNHDAKLLKFLRGRDISISHGIDKTIAELEARGVDFKLETAAFIDSLISHYVLDDGKLVISHAGLKQQYIGRASKRVRDFCLYGETTCETDEYGLPIRLDWAADYRGNAAVVFGHIAGKEVKTLNGTVCIDTGCVFGGKLTAYRYPEKEIISVDALKQYYEPIKSIEEENEVSSGDMLTVGDFNRKIHIKTQLMPSIDIHENNAAAALEIMSRYVAVAELYMRHPKEDDSITDIIKSIPATGGWLLLIIEDIDEFSEQPDVMLEMMDAIARYALKRTNIILVGNGSYKEVFSGNEIVLSYIERSISAKEEDKIVMLGLYEQKLESTTEYNPFESEDEKARVLEFYWNILNKQLQYNYLDY